MTHKRLGVLFSAVVLLFLGACQKAPKLAVTGPTSIEMSADGSSGSITFTANRDWSADWSASWFHVSPSSGSASDGPITLTVQCDANTTYDPRSGSVTITAEGLTQTFTVNQPANEDIIINQNSCSTPWQGGTLEVKVQANVEFEVTTSVDWIHHVSTKALSSSTVSLTVDENNTYASRTGKVEIKQKGGGLFHTVTVSQAGKIAVTSVSLDKSSLTLQEGESVTLTATVKPNDAMDKTVTWSSSNTSVAKVDGNGKVTGVSKGEASIIARAGEKSATCTVTVASGIMVTYYASRLYEDHTDIYIYADNQLVYALGYGLSTFAKNWSSWYAVVPGKYPFKFSGSDAASSYVPLTGPTSKYGEYYWTLAFKNETLRSALMTATPQEPVTIVMYDVKGQEYRFTFTGPVTSHYVYYYPYTGS